MAIDSRTLAASSLELGQKAAQNNTICEHNSVSTTRELGPHCCDCGEPLAGMFWPISRNTAVGELIYAMRTAPTRATP